MNDMMIEAMSSAELERLRDALVQEIERRRANSTMLELDIQNAIENATSEGYTVKLIYIKNGFGQIALEITPYTDFDIKVEK